MAVKNKKFATFAEFFSLWATLQKWEVPEVHWNLVEFLSGEIDYTDEDAVTTALIECFRGFSKSTIAAAWVAWRLYKECTLRILVFSADTAKAVKFVRDVKGVITRHPLCTKLLDEDNIWREADFWVKGNFDERCPSLGAYGILSNATSARCDILVYDDVEVAKNADTEGKREKLRDRLAETFCLLAPKKREQLYIGTPHTTDTIYNEIEDSGARTIKIPLMTNIQGVYPHLTGDSAWPEMFDEGYIKECQVKMRTERYFYSQYQLKAISLGLSKLDPEDLVPYDSEVTYFRDGEGHATLSIEGKRIISCSAFWDVAAGKANGDDSVVAICFITRNGHYWLHRIYALPGDIYSQAKQLAAHLQFYKVPSIRVETNGVGIFAPTILRKAMNGVKCSIIDHYSKGKKEVRIEEAYVIPLSGHIIHASAQVLNGPLRGQMEDFGGKEKDDYIDSSASAISLEPVRLFPMNQRKGIRTDHTGGWRGSSTSNYKKQKSKAKGW